MKKIILWIMIFVLSDAELLHGMTTLRGRLNRLPTATKTLPMSGKVLSPSTQPIEPISQSLQSKLAYLKQKDLLYNFNQKELSSTSSKGLWSGLFATLGLGWLWSNAEDEDEKVSAKEIDQNYVSLDDLVKKFAPPKEIQDTIEAHKNAIATSRRKPYLIEGTQPPIYHKGNYIDRVINAELLKEVIKENNLDILIPQKYMYPNPHNGKYEVFTQGMSVRPLGNDTLNLQETQALIKLTTESGYSDFKQENLFRDIHTNKLVIIDTEDASFGSFGKYAAVNFVISRLNDEFKLQKNAQVWALDYLTQLGNSDSKTRGEEPDLYTSRYNKLHISAKNARKLQFELAKQHQKQETFTAKILWSIKHAIRS